MHKIINLFFKKTSHYQDLHRDLVLFLKSLKLQVNMIAAIGSNDIKMKTSGRLLLNLSKVPKLQLPSPLARQKTKRIASSYSAKSTSLYVTKPTTPNASSMIRRMVIFSSATPMLLTFFLAKSFFSTNSCRVNGKQSHDQYS